MISWSLTVRGNVSGYLKEKIKEYGEREEREKEREMKENKRERERERKKERERENRVEEGGIKNK